MLNIRRKVSSLLVVSLVAGMGSAAVPIARAADESYIQNLDSGDSLIAEEGNWASIVRNGTGISGMEGNALRIAMDGGNLRAELTEFDQNPNVQNENGSYEFVFRTGDNLSVSTSFLLRYKDERHYIGVSFENTSSGALCMVHNSDGADGSGRDNSLLTPVQQDVDLSLKRNTSYEVKVKYSGKKLEFAFREVGAEKFIEFQPYTLKTNGYEGAGAFAVRMNSGSSSIMLDNVKKKDGQGNIVKEMDFDEMTEIPVIEVRENKGTAVITDGNRCVATLDDSPNAVQIDGFENEKLNELEAAKRGMFVDEQSTLTRNGIYEVQINSNTNEYGLVFNYEDNDNYATIEFDGNSWAAKGRKSGTNVDIELNESNLPELQADKKYTFELDYQRDDSYELTIDDTTYELGELDVYKGAGHIGVAMGEQGILYSSALTLLPTSTLDPNDKVGDALEWLTDERVLNGNHSFDTIYTDLYLPTEANSGAKVKWESSNLAITESGTVTRPEESDKDTEVTLKAIISAEGDETQTKTYKATVKKLGAYGDFFDKKELDMWYDEPSFDDSNPGDRNGQNWQKKAMMLGNGYMGALIYGGVKNETWNLNEKTLWQGGPGTGGTEEEIYGNWEKTKAGLVQLRKEIAESSNKEVSTARAQQLLTNSSSALFREKHGTFQPMVDMELTMSHGEETEKYIRGLDLDTATSVVEYEIDGVTYQREHFMSYPDNVLVTRITASERGKVGFDIGLSGRQPEGYTVTSDVKTKTVTLKGALPDWKHNENPGVTLNGNGMKYEGQVTVLNDGGIVKDKDGKLEVANADSVVLLFAAGTDYVQDYTKQYKGEDPHEKVTDTIELAIEKGCSNLREDHLADYEKIYSRAKIDIGREKPEVTTDEMVDQYPNNSSSVNRYYEKLAFDFGRFLLISSSREGSLPANLQGVWNPIISPQWESDYHLNINMQMNYWMTDVLNMPEVLEPVTDYLQDIAKAGTVTAEKMYGYEDGSWIMHNPMNPFGHTGLQFYDAGFWFPESSAWTLRQLVEHYDFTRDADYLENELYDLMEGNTRFWTNYLVEDPWDPGVLICNPTCIPEQAPFTPAGSMSQQIVKDMLENFLMLSEENGIDNAFTKEVEDANKKIDNGLRVDEESGIVRDWKYKDSKVGGSFRHLNQLYALYPSNDLIFEESEDSDLLKASKTFLEKRTDDGTPGWSRAWRSALWSRLGDGELAHVTLEKLLASLTAHNLFMYHPPFQIDGNLGYSAAIAEMLLQSHAGYIDVLPALPSEWSNGSFENFVARGDFEVDANWTDGAYETIQITSGSGGVMSIKLEDQNLADVRCNGKKVTLKTDEKIDGVYSIETKAGDVITIQRDKEVKAGPQNVQSKRDLNGNVDVVWDEVPQAQSYVVYRYEGGEYEEMAKVDETSAKFSDSLFVGDGKTKNTSTQYVVSAIINEKESLYSAYTIPECTEEPIGPEIPSEPAELIGAWSFDDETKRGANDMDGGLSAKIGKAITYAEGKTGSAAVFTGENGNADSTVLVPIELVAEGKDIKDTSFSLSMWVKSTAESLPSGQTQSVLAQLVARDDPFNTLGTTKPPLLINYADGRRYGTSMTGQTVSLQAQNKLNVWEHVSVVYDAQKKKMSLYVDGKLEGTAENYIPTSEVGPLSLMFGQHRNQQWGFKGSMDEIKCFKGVLTEKEILTLYENK